MIDFKDLNHFEQQAKMGKKSSLSMTNAINPLFTTQPSETTSLSSLSARSN